MKRWLLSLLTVMLLFGCENKQQQVKDLNTEVMDIHDSAMVKMDAIYAQISKLRQAEELVAGDSAGPDAELEAEVAKSIGMLQAADDGMMDWMAAYEPPQEDADPDRNLRYLKEQKRSIISVAEDIDLSLEYAREVLSKIKAQ